MELISPSSIRERAVKAATRAAVAMVTAIGMLACSDAAAPRPIRAAVTILAITDSVFEGDVVRLTAVVLDDSGAEVAGAPVSWTTSDTTLATDAGEGRFALLRPGTVRITARSAAVTGTYDLVIGRLVVKRVDLSPGALSLGRGDRMQISARVFGQGDRAITGRPVTFTSDDPLVAVIGTAGSEIAGPGFLIATGPGSTTIRATVDAVTGTAPVGVVIADTTFVLTHYNGAPVPVLVAADTVLFNGVPEFAEVYAEPGTLVLSGLMQLRYRLEVRYSQYRVVRTGNTVERQLRFQSGEFDRGLVTVGAGGSLSMLSEFIGPHLEHTAAREPDGFLVRYRIPGDDSFLDLRYRRQGP